VIVYRVRTIPQWPLIQHPYSVSRVCSYSRCYTPLRGKLVRNRTPLTRHVTLLRWKGETAYGERRATRPMLLQCPCTAAAVVQHRRPPPHAEPRDENGRDRSRKNSNHFRFHILIWKRERERELSVGKTKTVMRDIGNGSIRSEACRLRAGTGTQKQ